MTSLKVLAVADPAVKVYVDKAYHILDDFEKKGIKVQFDIVSWKDYFPMMIESFEGNAQYDIVMIAGHLWLKDFVDKGYLSPIVYDQEDILPVIAKEMCYEGKTYLSPSFCDGHMIVYRKSVLKKVLGRLPKEIISADEVLEMAKKLYEYGYETPIALKAHASEILLDALPYLRSNSNKDVYMMEDSKEVCHIKEMEEGLNKYLRLRRYAPQNTHTYGNDEIVQAIVNQQVIMATTWSGQLGIVAKEDKLKEDLGFATFDTAWNVTWSFAITNNSKQKDKAAEFLSYLRSKEIDAVAGAYSGAPVRKNSYFEGMDKFPWYGVQLRMIEECAKPFIQVSNAGEKNDLLYSALYRTFINEEEPTIALDKVQRQVSSI